MDENDVLAALERLEAAGIRFWLDGGWGCDALLRRHTREHADLDLVIERDDWARAGNALAPLGYKHDTEVSPGLPARVVLLTPQGLQVDLHPVVFDERGNGWQELGEGAWGLYPREGLEGAGSVGGREVPCITPELQLRHRLGYAWTERDRHDLRLLADRFELSLPPGSILRSASG